MEFQVWAMKMEAEYWKGAFFWCTTHRVMLWRSSPKRPWVKWFKLENAKRRRGSRTFYDFARHARIKWVYPLWIVQFWQTELLQKITPLIGWEKKYMGIGPSAHGYNGISRSWNVSNNIILKSIQEEKLPNEIEVLRNGSLQWVCDDRIKDDLGRFDRIEAEFGRRIRIISINKLKNS
jgi:hypothetical protein